MKNLFNRMFHNVLDILIVGFSAYLAVQDKPLLGMLLFAGVVVKRIIRRFGK